MDRNIIFTIGHSTHEIERFLDLLQLNQISVIADVRSSPFSRFNPQFNRESLIKALADRSIQYVFLGKELGARSDDPACYEGGKVQYRQLAKSVLFKTGIDRILRGIKEHRVALMCAEKEPLDCHRTILVSQELEKIGISVRHILADGSLELHNDSLFRLFDLLRLPSEDLFRSTEELLAEAMALQESKIAYIETTDKSENEEMTV